MAPTKFNYLFAVASLLLLFAAQSPFAEARKDIVVNPWCRPASNRRLCTRMVKGAVTQNDAEMNVLTATLLYAKRLQGMIPVVKSVIAGLDLEKQNSIIKECAGDFNNNVDDLEKIVAAMQANDRGTAQTRLSAVLGRSNCVEELTENGVVSPIGAFANLLHKEVDNCLAVITQS